jgi:hypothetical protein
MQTRNVLSLVLIFAQLNDFAQVRIRVECFITFENDQVGLSPEKMLECLV